MTGSILGSGIPFNRVVPWRSILAGAVMVAGLGSAAVAGVYQLPEEFIAEAFDGAPPQAAKLWLSGDLKQATAEILGHPYGQLRVTYWPKEIRTAWVLDEIGKEQPITVGFVIGPTGIERLRILIYRESRGAEVRYPAFTGQFSGARLSADKTLDRPINGISGATLSVRAVDRLARLSLLLHSYVQTNDTRAPGQQP